MLGLRAERFDGALRLLTGGQKALDARRARELADFPMECRPLFADLSHVAKHQPALAGRTREHRDRRADRIGIRVVGIVDDCRAADSEVAASGRRAHRMSATDSLAP